jgi:putative ABC transport system permease protein
MPDWSDELRRRLARLQLRPEREAEIVEELSEHLEERYRELRDGGTPDAEARRLVGQELLEPEALATDMAALRQSHSRPSLAPGAPSPSWLGGLWQDLRYAARTLSKQPGFTAAAVLTLALGIGANSAIFALVDATLLRPLPFPHAERLVAVWERSETTARARVSPRNLVDWNQRSRTFEAIGGFVPNVGAMVMSGKDGMPESVPRQWVTAGFFDALGVKAVAGRTFLPSDDRERRNVVVISEAFWRARFAADPSVIGRDVRLDGDLWTVIGVVPQEAQLFGRTSLWALQPILGSGPDARRAYYLRAVGRMKPGASMQAADADMASLAEELGREFPDTNGKRGVALEPLHDAVIGSELRRTSLLFLGVVAFVLLICCANVANLLLARATVRRRELAIRSALGADRGRVIRLLLTESCLLSVIGSALGLLLAAGILSAAPALIPADLLSAAVSVSLSPRVVGFCAAAALFVGVIFALAPAWQATEFSSAQALASDGRSVTGRGGRIREWLVTAEVATAVILLFGAGLLLRTLSVVENVDRGHRTESALTMIVDPPFGGERLIPFYDAAANELAALPAVRGVAWATTLPLGRSYVGRLPFEIFGDAPVLDAQRPTADYQIVSPTYFGTLELPIVAGRAFDERDTRDSAPVCMVNEAFVRRHLGGRSPLGMRVALRRRATSATPVVREIVGVARQVKGRPDETEDFVQLYAPLAQDPVGDIFMIVRPASGSADALTPVVRAAIARVDKEGLVSLRNVMTLEDVAREATSRHRFRAVLVMAFAGLALLLAMVGLFGVLAYSVQQRVRDFGVRRALGATTRDVLRLVASSTARIAATGTLVGLALAAALGRLLTAMLFGVQPLDALTFAAVAAVLGLTALLSAAGPAWRASRVDPASALRNE